MKKVATLLSGSSQEFSTNLKSIPLVWSNGGRLEDDKVFSNCFYDLTPLEAFLRTFSYR